MISTFAGCGGSSLGYKWAGYEELLAVEWDDNAVATFKHNFPGISVYHGDITKLSSAKCMELSGIKKGELDVFEGSPPCQSFSSEGNRKNRSNINDKRTDLFKEYARLINDLQPKVFAMENVKGMIAGHIKHKYLECINLLRDCGYKANGQLLNAMHYSVPQSRERVIIIGVRKDLGIEPSHPKPLQNKPITVREAFAGVDLRAELINDQTGKPFPGWLLKAVQEIKPFNDSETIGKAFIKHKGTSGSSRSFKLLAWNRPSCTIVKDWIAASGIGHPDKKRYINLSELKRLSSFPDDFEFTGSFKDGLARIGNSVPPKLAYAIANHIKEEILSKIN